MERSPADRPPTTTSGFANFTLGTAAEGLLERGLGTNLGGVFEAELAHYAANEWATTSEDVLWRRTKLGLHLMPDAKARVAAWFGEASAPVDDVPLPGHRFATPGDDAALV